MADPFLVLLSQNHWTADGSQTEWNFTFEDGYLSTEYVKAYYEDLESNRTEVVVTEDMFSGEFQLTVTPPVPAGYLFVIYRDTPKNEPLVDYSDGANVSETNLDNSNRQAIHCIQEVLDGAGGSLTTQDLGFKDIPHNEYTGSSTILAEDRGCAHYKEDGTGVTVPNTLPNEMLVTVINESDSEMPLAFVDCVARLQGTTDPSSAAWLIAPHNSVSLHKVKSGVWYLAGLAQDNS